ncbi:DUF2550 domain-containing protein [Zafaria sp. Z1313]|uniref:DUF2550 domain-containing protein n=1 Tax=Zafaria sp. Z1313 TaxID=3423202 RepID=UPI003D302D1D
MNDVGLPFAILAAALLLILMALGAMGLRRFQLRRALGTFDASISTAPGRWMMGVCRYGENHLEFLRLFSVSPVPRRRFVRSSLELRGWRDPLDEESGRIQPGSVVVTLDYRGESVLLAMDYGAYTGLSSWLEAGPVVGVGTWR